RSRIAIYTKKRGPPFAKGAKGRPPGSFSQLEDVAQRELDIAALENVGVGEAALADDCVGAGAGEDVGARFGEEVGVVENVQEVGGEAELMMLPRHFEAFAEGGVEAPDAGSAEIVAAGHELGKEVDESSFATSTAERAERGGERVRGAEV